MNAPKHPAEGWRDILNVMARVDMELECWHALHASTPEETQSATNELRPTTLCVGRKEMYELKRDWREWLNEQPDGTLCVRGLRVQVVDATSELFLR